MPINRYDTISTSTYTPRSLQETLMVPLMRRQQHDDANKQLYTQLGELDKVDPLDVHYNEAQKIKSDLMNKINTQAETLSKEGFNVNTTGDIFKTNREVAEQYSPTGKIGQINAAKIAEKEAFKRFLDSDDAKSNSQDVNLANWQKFKKGYTGYDDSGKITNIGDLGAVKYIDVPTYTAQLAQGLGFNESSSKVAGSYLQDTGNINGTRYVVDTTKAIKDGSNIKQLQSLANTLNQQLLDVSSPLRKSIDYTGRDLNKVANQINSQLGIYSKNERVRESGINYSNVDFYNPPKGDDNPEDPNYDGVNVEGVSVPTNSLLLEGLEGRIPDMTHTNVTGSPLTMGTSGNNKYRAMSPEQKSKMLNSQEYLTLARSIQKTQGIKVKDLRDPKVQDAVKKYLANNKDVTLQNKFIDPNATKVGKLFASKEVSKDKKATSDLMMERAQQGAYEVRDIKGNLIPAEELGQYTFSYSGDMTAKSNIGNIFSNPKQNIGARRGLLYNPETKTSTQVYVSRGADDFDTPQYKGMKIINEITKITDSRPNIYHQLKVPALKRFGISNFEVKYNKGSDTYDISYKDNDGAKVKEDPMSDAQFQEYILNTQLLK